MGYTKFKVKMTKVLMLINVAVKNARAANFFVIRSILLCANSDTTITANSLEVRYRISCFESQNNIVITIVINGYEIANGKQFRQ